MSERYKLIFRSRAERLGLQPTFDAEGNRIYTIDDLAVVNPISAVLGRPTLYTRQQGLMGAIHFLDQEAMAWLFGDTRAHHLLKSGQIYGIGQKVQGPGWFQFLDHFQEKTGTLLHDRVATSALSDNDQEVAELIHDLATDFYGPEMIRDFRNVVLDGNELILRHPRVFTLSGTFFEVIALFQGFQGGAMPEQASNWAQRWWDFEYWVEQEANQLSFREYTRGLMEKNSSSEALEKLLERYMEFRQTKHLDGCADNEV